MRCELCNRGCYVTNVIIVGNMEVICNCVRYIC